MDYGSPMNILSNTVNLGHYFYETMIPKKVKPNTGSDDNDKPVL